VTHLLAAGANADVPINVAQNVGFGIIAAAMVVGAVRVVTTSNVVHAALWLVLVLAGAAAQFILLTAEFVALTQVLVYIGAIVVLFLFGVMLTRAMIGGDANLTRPNRLGAALVGVLMLGLLSFTLLDTFGDDRLPADTRVTLRPVAVAQFENDTGIATAGLNREQLAAAVNDLPDLDDDTRADHLATARAITGGAGDGGDASLDSNVAAVSDSIFSQYLLPFEIVSVLLTAALIGAIVIARKE
jgi:NADH-quinone oxidoreductase subunit J